MKKIKVIKYLITILFLTTVPQAQAAENAGYEIPCLDILTNIHITPETIITMQAEQITSLEEEKRILHRQLQEMTIVASLIAGNLIKKSIPADSYHPSQITNLAKELIDSNKEFAQSYLDTRNANQQTKAPTQLNLP